MTIICNDESLASLQLLKPSGMVTSPQKWKAFVINVIGTATEAPGAICYLSDYLSKEGMSILHISTYESEVFLVQEKDVENAFQVFKKIHNPDQISSWLLKLKQTLNQAEQERNIRDGFALHVLPKHVMLTRLSDHSSIEQISSTLVSLYSYSYTFMCVYSTYTCTHKVSAARIICMFVSFQSFNR